MFDDAIQLFVNAKKLIAATALDVINPKKCIMEELTNLFGTFFHSADLDKRKLEAMLYRLYVRLSILRDSRV